MGYYSDFWISTEGATVEDLQEWYRNKYGYELGGSGGTAEIDPTTIEAFEMKWYDFEGDIPEFMRSMAGPIRVWALRMGENGMTHDLFRYVFEKKLVDGHWAIDVAKDKIDPRKLAKP